MDVFIVLWSYLLTTKLRCLQKNNIGHNTKYSFNKLPPTKKTKQTQNNSNNKPSKKTKRTNSFTIDTWIRSIELLNYTCLCLTWDTVYTEKKSLFYIPNEIRLVWWELLNTVAWIIKLFPTEIQYQRSLIVLYYRSI